MKCFLVVLDTGAERLPVKNEEWIPVQADSARDAALKFAGESLEGFGAYTIHTRPDTSKLPCVVHTFDVIRSRPS